MMTKKAHSFKWSLQKVKKGAALIGVAVLATFVLGACSSNDASSNSEAKGDYAESPAKQESDTSGGDTSMPGSEEPAPDRGEGKGKRGYGSQDRPAEAGQLTAGEWDDLAAWDRFNNLLNSREGDESKRTWNFDGFNRVEVIVTSNGKAAADAEVKVLQGNQTVWEARTNTEGRAYVFAGMFRGNDEAHQSEYAIEARSGQQSKAIENIDIAGQGAVKIDLGADAPKLSDGVDIMFVVDTTGSMQDELDYLEAELKDVLQRVSKEHANQLQIRLSANFYRDKHDDYIVKPFPFVTNVDKVVEQIGAQEAKGGGDYPEAVDQALRDAVEEHKWSEEARARLMFLVLDAPPHDDPQIIDEVQRLTQKAAAQGIRIIPVASSGVDVDTEYLLRFMAVATGGTYLFLTDDSGIGGDHLEPAVGEYEVKLLNDLLVEVINRYVQQ